MIKVSMKIKNKTYPSFLEELPQLEFIEHKVITHDGKIGFVTGSGHEWLPLNIDGGYDLANAIKQNSKPIGGDITIKEENGNIWELEGCYLGGKSKPELRIIEIIFRNAMLKSYK